MSHLRTLGDFISYRHSAGSGTTAWLQAKVHNWPMPIRILLLSACVVVAVLVMQIASAQDAAPEAPNLVGNEKQEERDEGCPGARCSDKVAPPHERQTSESDMAAPPPEPDKLDRNANRSGLPQLVLPADVARKVGHKIWLNETGGNRDAITSWNANEDFASLGIGHFIWFPAGKTAPFEESFPPLIMFLRTQENSPPPWLDKIPIPPCPWTHRTDFRQNFNSHKMKQLRQFLLDTIAGQTQFLIMRAQGAMNKIIESTPEAAERERIIMQFSRIAHASKDLYPLIDYINFKGEGTNPAETAPDKETGTRQGWGLKQVLLKMTGSTSDPVIVLSEFADAAQFVLQQRVRNIPANRIWKAGWLRRVETYRRPITDLVSEPKRARNKPVRKDG